jgi:hypothetical protein
MGDMRRWIFFLTNNYFSSTSDRNYSSSVIYIQGDSLWGGPELIIINHAVIYPLKPKFVSEYLGRYGGNWVTEELEFLTFFVETYADTMLYVAECYSQWKVEEFLAVAEMPRLIRLHLISVKNILCYWVLFSCVNYCVIYINSELYPGESPCINIF